MRKYAFLMALSFCLCGCCNSGSLDCVQVDPLAKIFLEDTDLEPFTEVLPYAKGETAAFQIVVNCPEELSGLEIVAGDLRCGRVRIAPTMTAFESYVGSGLHREPFSDAAVFPESDMYPDCLLEVPSMDVEAGRNQPVWVNYRIGKDVPAGKYSGKVTLRASAGGKAVSKAVPVALEVKNVTLPEQELFITNWHNHHDFHHMNGGEQVELFSERYFELLTEMVHLMRDHGQNVYWFFPLLDFVQASCDGGRWTFDFTNLNKTAEIFIREGNAKRLEGGQLGNRIGKEWESDFGIYYPGDVKMLPLGDKRTQAFLDSFIPALEANLREHGWWEMWVQHVGDEPFELNRQSYVDIVKKVKSLSPEMKIIDAIHSSVFDDVVDVWVPLLNLYHTGYQDYVRRQQNGDEVWFYTCLDPRGNYANRFLEHPLVQMRILHWMNFKYGATGYLHWGFNWSWGVLERNVAADDRCPGGDMFISYPREGGVYGSIRLEAMRDGIGDYGLLRLLQKKNPELARELVDSIVLDFDSYDNSIENFRRTRALLLKYLEQ